MRKFDTFIRHQKYIGVTELAAQAASILAESGPIQERGTVSELPDERTLRYYLAEGLISPAEEKQGTASVFGYQHLLQLLVVKKLQAEHLPIRKIRELVEGRSERQLERLLGVESTAKEGGQESGKSEALRYLESLLMRPTEAASAPARISQPLLSTPRSQAAPSPPQSSEMAAKWERIEIEPGLELHIRGDYHTPRDTKGLRYVAQRIMRIIETHRSKPGK